MLFLQSSLSQWQTVFWISAGVYLTGALIYVIVGSGVEQPWAMGSVTKVLSESKEGSIFLFVNRHDRDMHSSAGFLAFPEKRI